MNVGKLHEKLKPLFWLIGEWKSVTAVVKYPTMKCPVTYNEKLSFTSIGQPILHYSSTAWGTENNEPMHAESGFLRIEENESSVALIIAQKFGVATIEEGTLSENCMMTNTSCIGHMSFVKHKVISLHRCYQLNKKGQLEYRVMMETPHTPLTEHISALYEKC